MTMLKENYISVDIEASGPIPGKFSMLQIGACVIANPEINFECNLKPITEIFDPESMAVIGYSHDFFYFNGLEPCIAIKNFNDWVTEITQYGKPIFVGFNAPFDWSFINYYFHFFLGNNPFGFSALDIKALYMGKFGCQWKETKSSLMNKTLTPALIGDHSAINDAKYQAELFHLILDDC